MNLFAAWAFAKPILEAALVETHGTHTIDDVGLMIGSGQFALWTGEKSAALTEFVVFPRMKVVNIFACGGDLIELRDILENKIVPFAKNAGCSRITGAGRRGWARTPSDWEHGGVYMYKDL